MSEAPQSIKILYVEDEPDNIRIVSRILPPEFEVIPAMTGLEAIQMAPAVQPHLILVDLGLPDIDGYSVATKLRGLPGLARIPMVAITGLDDRDHALALGFDGFIAKPFDIDAFPQMLHDYLAGRREASAAEREPELARQVHTLVDDLEQRVRELSQANERLHELDRLRREFIQNITHELTTPLTPAMGYARILSDERSGPLTPLQRKCVDAMDLSLRRLQLLIDDLLDITRIEAGEFALVLSEVSPTRTAEEAENLVSEIAASKSISIETIVSTEGSLQADQSKVVQALVHLLRNALKFTPEGGKVLLEVREGGDGRTEFLVYDSGVGIPKEKLDRVFDPFFQVDGSTTRRFGGVGIGLTLVRRIVEAHGGSVWAESPPSEQPQGRYYRGARVAFSLPPKPPPTARLA